MSHEIFAAIPVTKTYALTDLAVARIAELERRRENLLRNQHARRRRIDLELEELNVAVKAMQLAQDNQIISIKRKLDANIAARSEDGAC